MRDQMDDYRRLMRIPPGQVAAWVHEEFPQGVRGQWVNAMLDIAITDYYPVNESPDSTPHARIQLAATLLSFAAEHHLVRDIFLAEWAMTFSKKAIEDGITGIPSALTAEAVVEYSLACFELTREDALATASASSRAGEYSARLSRLKFLLKKIAWFADKINDPGLAREVLSWLEIKKDLELD